MKTILLTFVVAIGLTQARAMAAAPATSKPVAARSFESGDYDPALVQEVTTLQKQLVAAAATQPSHPIAGQYYQGDGLGMNLMLTIGPSMEYTVTWHGCLGLYFLDRGTVARNDNAVELHPTLKQAAGQRFGVDRKLTRVAWGKRTYLLSKGEMDGFIQHVNDGTEPRTDMHEMGYMKFDDEKRDVTGDPELPGELAKRLAPFVEAKITKVGAERILQPKQPKFAVRKVTLDIGENDGVRENARFYCDGERAMLIFITKVNEHSCDGEVSGLIGQTEVAVGTHARTRRR